MDRRWLRQGGFGALILVLLAVDIVLVKLADERMFLGDFTVEGRVVTASHGSVTVEGYTLTHSTGEALKFFNNPKMKIYNNYFNGSAFDTTYVGHAFRNGHEIKPETLRQGQHVRATGQVIKDYRQLVMIRLVSPSRNELFCTGWMCWLHSNERDRAHGIYWR